MPDNIDLGGWWKIRFDERDEGRGLGWFREPPSDCRMINLPSCWNEVFPEYFHYQGVAWYFRDIALTDAPNADRYRLHFEGVNYRCEVFVNGQSVGTHEGGFTPFALDATGAIRPAQSNRVAIRVDARLGADTLPPSGVDWFNYGGIYRSLYLETAGLISIDDFTLKTRLDGAVTVAATLVNSGPPDAYRLVARIKDQTGQAVATQEQGLALAGGTTDVVLGLTIADPRLWRLGDGYLYTLTLELLDSTNARADVINHRFGIREFRVSGHKILLNGEEVKLVGCSKHDEYPLTGRAVTRAQLIKDYDLLRQMNANCVRLAHYPHNRLEHAILDELGMVAISEIPMVFLREAQMTDPAMLAKSQAMLAEMIRAEKNSTCVMFWSLFIECETDLPSTRAFVQALVGQARALDDTRLIVMASNRPLTDVTYDYFDVVGVNYWRGWYDGESADDGATFLATMAERYPAKPLLITSHGWEGLYGSRSYVEHTPWSEDLQARYLARIAEVYLSFKNVVGEIVWTFADFRVSDWADISNAGQPPAYLGRPDLVNHKGMVDFYRRPKSTYAVMKCVFSAWHERVAPALPVPDGRLRSRIFATRQAVGQALAHDFIDAVQAGLANKPTLNILFASAASQVEFLEALARNRMFVDWSRIIAFHLDEYVGAGPDTPFGFARWLTDHLTGRLPFRRFEALDGQASDLDAECQRYGALLNAGDLDLVCLGIGENGHLAFNDPANADFDDRAVVKVVDLDDACREQQFREGVFEDIRSVPRRALTVTLPALLRARRILGAVTGPHKAVAVWKTLRGEVSPACPATILRAHADATLYLDPEAAALAYPALAAPRRPGPQTGAR